MTLVPKENGRTRDKTLGATNRSKGTYDGTTRLRWQTRDRKEAKITGRGDTRAHESRVTDTPSN